MPQDKQNAAAKELLKKFQKELKDKEEADGHFIHTKECNKLLRQIKSLKLFLGQRTLRTNDHRFGNY